MKLWDKLQRCSVKKVFLEISQNLPENTCVGVAFLIKFQALEFFKNTLQNPSGGCFFIKDFFCRFFVTKKVSNKSFQIFWFK